MSRFAPDLPADAVADLHQVHGACVVDAVSGEPGQASRPEADALVTDRSDVVLMVRAADCVPVLVADPDAGLVGAAHAGRQGVLRGVVPATVARLRARGARDLVAWIGPHVCAGCYEVPEALRAEVAAAVPATYAVTRAGTPSLDLGAGVRAQLEADGVVVRWSGGCTREDPALYSHRRDGAAAGRLAGLIRRRP